MCNGQSTGSINFREEPEKRLILIFRYRNRLEDNDWLEGEGMIPLTTTPCQFGGIRHSLECPHCARRREILYMQDTSFYCRQCSRLLYPSQLEGKHSRACGKPNKLYEKLHGKSRPRIWKRTRERLYFEYLFAEAGAINVLTASIVHCWALTVFYPLYREKCRWSYLLEA
jgi:hypothetical protein